MINKIGGKLKSLILLLLISIVILENPIYASLGFIEIKTGFTVTPAPNPPTFPTNILFYDNNGSPYPTTASITDPAKIGPRGSASDAFYDINFASDGITILIINGTHYGRTSTATNVNGGATGVAMKFPQGALKQYVLDYNVTTPYEMTVPNTPTDFTVTLEGYTVGDFKPIIKVKNVVDSDSVHEVDTYPATIVLKGTTTSLGSTTNVGGEWAIPTTNLLPANTTHTYTVSVWAHDYLGNSASPVTKDIVVPAPSGGGVGPLTLTSIYAYKDPLDPHKYALTYYAPYYVKGGYLTCGDVLTAINNAIHNQGLDSSFTCLEVNYWNQTNQGWDVAAQWIDWNNVAGIYYVKSGLPPGTVTYSYPVSPNQTSIAFTDGQFVYLGFGKMLAAKDADGGWRAEVKAGDPAYNNPLVLTPAFTWNP